VRYLPDKKNKISPGSPALATAQIAPKICHGQPPTTYPECSRFHPNRFTFSGVISESVTTVRAPRSKVNPTFGWNLVSSRIISLGLSSNTEAIKEFILQCSIIFGLLFYNATHCMTIHILNNTATSSLDFMRLGCRLCGRVLAFSADFSSCTCS